MIYDLNISLLILYFFLRFVRCTVLFLSLIFLANSCFIWTRWSHFQQAWCHLSFTLSSLQMEYEATPICMLSCLSIQPFLDHSTALWPVTRCLYVLCFILWLAILVPRVFSLPRKGKDWEQGWLACLAHSHGLSICLSFFSCWSESFYCCLFSCLPVYFSFLFFFLPPSLPPSLPPFPSLCWSVYLHLHFPEIVFVSLSL